LTDPRLDDPKLLEPWMLDQLQEDGSADDPDARQELARLVALLRSLPEPESAPDLSARVLAYVAQQESKPRVVRMLSSRPGSALLVAASVAALFAVTFAPETTPSVLRDTEVRRPTAPVPYASMQPTRPRRRPIVVQPQWVVHTSSQTPSVMQAPPAAGPRAMGFYVPADQAFDHGLDHQLNQLMMNPTAFAQQLERVAQPNRVIARLARRAAERGDAPEIALRVRDSEHPLAGVLTERMLHATLVTEVRPR
jgi:hypothetical protein